MPTTERQVTVGDVRLSIAEAGAGQRPLLLAHGFTLADALGWDRYVLLGHSMGGMVAQVIACSAPERLVFAGILAEREGPLSTPAHQRLLAGQPGYAEFCDRKLRATSPAMYSAMAPVFMAAPDRLDDLRGLPAALPVLVIVGEQDKPFLRASERMAAGVGQASLEVIPDAGHSPQFENPEAWWQALSTFLAKLPAA